MKALEGGRARDPGADQAREPGVWLACLLLAIAAALVAVWAVQRTTWYLAIDQFGYLTFARDLAHGRVLHEWRLGPVMSTLLPRGVDVDVFVQTYIRRGNELFCRYSPGFPLVLAATRILFGPTAEHYVNPAAVVLLLGCLFVMGRRALASAWLGLAAALLVVLLPNYVLLWSTSPLRDVPAHLFAMAALALLLPGGRLLRAGWREVLAGFLLGCAVTTRVDAVLYGLPAASLSLLDRKALVRRGLLGVAGVAIGVAPLLAYNTIATGNPFRPTQAMEVNSVFSRAQRPDTWWQRLVPGADDALAADDVSAPAATPAPRSARSAAEPAPTVTPFRVQGGGLRFSHLAQTLPENLSILHEIFGNVAIVLALVGAVAALARPALFLLVVPYCVVAVLFFSMWTLPGARYLTGVLLLVPLLVLEGARSLASLPATLVARGHRAAGVLAATLSALLVIALVVTERPGVPSALPWVNVVLAGAVVLAAIAGAWRPDARPALLAALALGLGLSLTLVVRSTTVLGTHASFQGAQVARARATLEGALEGRAIVLTTTRIGRPAENINYYTSANALYLEELFRWGASPSYAVKRMIHFGFSVYLLLTPEDARTWLDSEHIAPWYAGDTVRVVAPEDAVDYFVASPFHRGLPLVLVRLKLKPRTR